MKKLIKTGGRYISLNVSIKYLTKNRILCHSPLHQGLWLAVYPVQPQKADLPSPKG